jgi:hypothetical protein
MRSDQTGQRERPQSHLAALDGQIQSRPEDLKIAARELGVATVLEGNLQKAAEVVLE